MSFSFKVDRPAQESGECSSKPLRAFVVGGSGQIGGWLLRVLEARGHHGTGTYATREFPGLVPFDASDRETRQALVRRYAPDVVFYPAGFTWVDGCERDPDRAVSANLQEPLDVAEAAAAIGARFVYFSTDYVFDGVSGPYSEDAPTNPLSEYGRAKRDAELALEQALGDLLLTVRTSWVFGPERQGKNFAYQLVRGLSQGKTMTCPSDQISSPSYGPDVARTVVELVECGASGLVNVVGPEVMNRVEFANAVAQAFKQDASKIVGRLNEELGQIAPRPLNSGLRTELLQSVLPGRMRPLEAALQDFQARLDSSELQSWVEPILPA